ncbi:MAG TPA: hybrid sensor histidine kinase/response regulator [Planctomycetes bacterium]|nr:hybrid sensor histidine kinase/response regulator [Planctomycetota bacterium]
MVSEQQLYADAWKASPLAILTLNDEGVIFSANPAAVLIFSMEEEDLKNAPLNRFVHRLDGGALQAMLDEVRGGEIPNRQEIRFETPRRGEFVTGVSLAPTPELQGGSVAVIRDLGKEKAFRPQLLHTERMATMGSIASVVAHELNNALAGALGCLDEAKPNAADFDRLIDTAKNELLRASEIVKDLKEYARVDDDLSENIDISELCQKFARLHKFHSGRVRLALDVAEGLPTVRGNSNQLIQSLLNLVFNAEYASTVACSEDEPHVEMSARCHADVIHLDVIDHGPGIPKDKRSGIFDPFYSTKPVGEGTGLGLTVVQAIAATHGGRVEIHDTPGGGATFRIILPSVEVSTQPALEPPKVTGTQANLRGVRILIAEDEQSIRRFLGRAFERIGADATLVEDATQAIEAARGEDFELLLLDMRMPGGGGVEAYQRIREVKPELAQRTVFMTGELSVEMSQIVGQDYAGVLQKPFLLQELVEVMQNAREIGGSENSRS